MCWSGNNLLSPAFVLVIVFFTSCLYLKTVTPILTQGDQISSANRVVGVYVKEEAQCHCVTIIACWRCN